MAEENMAPVDNVDAVVESQPQAPAYDIRNDNDVNQAINPEKALISGEVIIIIVLVIILIGGLVFFLQRKRQQGTAVPKTEAEADLNDEKAGGEEA